MSVRVPSSANAVRTPALKGEAKGPGGPQEYAKFRASPGCESLGRAIDRLAADGQLEAALEPKLVEFLGPAMRALKTKT